jgi:hypothetical protein
MAASPTPTYTFTLGLRCATILWLLIWIPAYWRTWGVANFLHLCDIAVLVTCVGLLANSALLISSQAVGSLLVDLAWMLDAGWHLARGHGLLGGADYLFDETHPLWVRLLSLFHVVMPVLLLWALSRTGYDRRGWPLQSLIALVAFAAARWTSPAQNINFAFSDPFIHRAWGPPASHVLISWLFMTWLVYFPTHLVLRRVLEKRAGSSAYGA